VTFARRLVLGTVIVLLFTILVLIWSAERSLRRNLESDVANTLLREARLVRAALPPDSVEWPAAIRRLALENGIRIVLLDREGHIRADSGELPATPSSGASRGRWNAALVRRPARRARRHRPGHQPVTGE
jgi:hypothetical protein